MGEGQWAQQAHSHHEKSEFDEALETAIEGLKHRPTPKDRIFLNELAASILSHKGKLRKALHYAEMAVEEAESQSDLNALCICTLTIGKVLAKMERYSAAAKAWRELRHAAIMKEDKKMEGKALVNLAIVDQRRGFHDRALTLLEKAEACMRDAEYTEGLAFCYSRRIRTYTLREEYDKTLECLDELERLSNQLDDKFLKAMTFFRKGEIHLKRDEYKEALFPIEEAYRLFVELGDAKNSVWVGINLVRTYIGAGTQEKIESVFKEMEDTSESVDSNTLKSSVRQIGVEIAVDSKDWTKAVRFCSQALEIIQALDSKTEFEEFHETLKIMVEGLGLDTPGLEKMIMRARPNYGRMGLNEELKDTESWLYQIARDKKKNQK